MMTVHRFAMFDTAIGHCGLVWSARGVISVQLPEADEQKTRARMQRRFLDARQALPPADIQHAIDGITALLRGEKRDLTAVAIDDNGISDFNKRVYAIARTIPPGQTITYGQIAERLGDRLLAREVGQAMGENPTPLVMPCHRVLAAGGKTGGFSANGGVTTKLQLLNIEGAQPDGPTLFDSLPLATRKKADR